MTVIILLVLIWAILAIVGFAFKGLLWLAVVGIVLVIGTVTIGITRRVINRGQRVDRTNRTRDAGGGE